MRLVSIYLWAEESKLVCWCICSLRYRKVIMRTWAWILILKGNASTKDNPSQKRNQIAPYGICTRVSCLGSRPVNYLDYQSNVSSFRSSISDIYIVYPHLDAQGARETYYYNGALCLRSYRSDARLPTEPGWPWSQTRVSLKTLLIVRDEGKCKRNRTWM